MESKDTKIKAEEQRQSKTINSNNKLNNLKSDYFIRKLFEYMSKRQSLETIKYNKKIQKRMDINIKDYKDYSEKYSSIELEIIPMKGKYVEFINIEEKDKDYYHIYFNGNKEKEIKIIKVIIGYQIESFEGLFESCNCIESINFKKFYRNNITDMSGMFHKCSSLKELNLNNFNTTNVTNMSLMFFDAQIIEIKN